MRTLLTFAWILTSLPVFAQQKTELDGIIEQPEFWNMTTEEFSENYLRKGFRWNSTAKQAARADGKRQPLQLLGQKVGETIISFDEETASTAQVAIYARGDDGVIKEKPFYEKLRTWKELLDSKLGIEGERKRKDNKSAVRAEGMLWKTESTAYLLEYSAQKESRQSPFKSEFIRLRVKPFVKLSFSEEKLAKEERVSRADLPDNVEKLGNGDVIIKGVPMVDQGQKGYCVVATAARVFGYYSINVDQNELAQIASSSAKGGTSTTAMIEALDDIAGRFKVNVKTHNVLEYSDIKDLTKDYNRAAKRADKPELPEGNRINYWDHFDSFDPEVLKAARLKSSSGIKKFKADVERTIDKGVPLLWTVTVGIFEEPVRISQTRGGHMRMIIGYNWKTNEIIFTDSWGAGHEAKRWGVEEAFCSSIGTYSIKPIK